MARHSSHLATLGENLGYMIDRFVSMPRPAEPEANYCSEMASACRWHRQAGIVSLLRKKNVAAFRDDLRQAALLHLDLLDWLRGRERDPDLSRYLNSGDPARLFDALAAGDMETAKAIAVASQAPYDSRYEYEDDYCYAHFLYQLVIHDLRVDEVWAKPLLQQISEIVGDEAAPRLELCVALQTRDKDAFAAALEMLIQENEALFAEKGRGIVADPDAFDTERLVFVEGFALKTLAMRMGIAVANEDRLTPMKTNGSSARIPFIPLE